MIVELFAIKDIKAGVYKPMFFAKNTIDAVRSAQQAALDNKTELSKYPEDFELFKLLEIDDNSGKVKKNDAQHICNIVSLVNEYLQRSNNNANIQLGKAPPKNGN